MGDQGGARRLHFEGVSALLAWCTMAKDQLEDLKEENRELIRRLSTGPAKGETERGQSLAGGGGGEAKGSKGQRVQVNNPDKG